MNDVPSYLIRGGVSIDHFALGVRKGQLGRAAAFFSDVFGWMEMRPEMQRSSYAESRFMMPNVAGLEGWRVELTEAVVEPFLDQISPGHLAVRVEGVSNALIQVGAWAKAAHTSFEVLKDGTKTYIKLDDVFMEYIELVPRMRAGV